MESKNSTLILTGPDGWMKWGDIGQKVQSFIYARQKSSDVLPHTVPPVNNTELYTYIFHSLDIMLSILTTINKNNNNKNNRGSERKFSYVIKVSYDLNSSDDFTSVK